MAAQQALDVLLESQDYAGALELIDQLKALLQQPQMMGLQCLRHLPPRLMDVAAAVDGALANEFLSTVTNPDVGSIAAQAAADAEAHPGVWGLWRQGGAACLQHTAVASGSAHCVGAVLTYQDLLPDQSAHYR